jgi:hypothetical protein
MFIEEAEKLARSALRRQPDPARAVAVWLGMAAGKKFREGPLLDFLRQVSAGDGDHENHDTHSATVAASAESSSADERGQFPVGIQDASASSSADNSSADAVDHGVRDTHATLVTASADTQREGGDRVQPVAQSTYVAPLADQQLRAVTGAKEASARVMSGVYITDSRGDRLPVEELAVSGLAQRLRQAGKRIANTAVEYNTLYLIHQYAKRQAFVPRGMQVGGLLSASEYAIITRWAGPSQTRR